MKSLQFPKGVPALILGLALTAFGQDKPPAVSAAAPEAKAAITGTVSDQAGAGVANATVTVDNGTGFTQNATSDGQGLYAITDLPAGQYTMSVVVGSVKVFQASVTLSPGQVLTMGVAGAPVAQPSAPVPRAASQTPPPTAPSQTAEPSSTTTSPAQSEAPVSKPAQAAPPAPSGNGPASLSGTVTDQTGAVVVGASVKVSHPGTTAQTAVSDAQGNYSLKGLPPGAYTVTASAKGFSDFVADNLSIAAGQELPLDISLQPQGEKTEVNVQGEKVAQVETENAQVAGTITEKEVLTLGLNGRNFSQLIALTPGVSNQTGQDEAKVGVTGSVKYSVNGGRVEYNTFEVDGSDVLNAGLNGAESTLVVYPSLDAIQEVKVLTSNYGAMYGRTASGTVMVTTKSGGSSWHGDVYEFLRNEAFNARNYFDQTKSAPLYRRNDFGFTIGGPVLIPHLYEKKDKTFVFWSEEFRLENSPNDFHPDFNHGVPSLAERQGDFSDVCPAISDPTNPSNGLFFRSKWPDCPSAGTSNQVVGAEVAFPNNNVAQLNPFSALDTNALALLSTNLIPLPNATSGCNSSIGSCYDAVISEPTYWREELFRLDHNFSTKIKGSFRYIHDAWDTTVPVPQWGFAKDTFPTVQNRFIGPGTSLVAEFTQTINPTLLNQFTASYSNSHITLANVNGPGGANYLRPAGLDTPCAPNQIGSVNCPMGSIFSNFVGKAPGIVIAGTNLAYGGSGFAVDTSYMPWDHTNPIFSYRDDISKVIGKHTLQFGVQLVFAEKNEVNGAIGAASGDTQGLLTFSNVNGGVGNTGNAFANFLILRAEGAQGINAIQSYTQDSAQRRYYNRYRIGEPYVQDDWRVNSRLTVNLGVRFSLFGVYHEKYLREYNWDPSRFDPVLAAQVRVDPGTGQLISRPQQTPIPIDLASPDPRILNGLVLCGVNGVPAGCMDGHVFNPAPRVGIAWDPRGNGKTSIRAGYGLFFEHGTGEEANTGSLEASAPYVLNMTQRFPSSYGCIGGSAGASGFCSASPGAYPLNVTAIPNKAIWPYAQQWSLSVQREMSNDVVATFAYVGSKGTHLTVERQLNQLKPLPAAVNPFGLSQPILPEVPAGATGGDCAGFFPDQSGTLAFHLRNGTTIGPQDPAYINLEAACAGENLSNPTDDVGTLRPYPGLGDIFSLQNIADSSYHAFQATLRRTKGPLTLGVSYSYSHSLDDSSDRSDATFLNSYDLRSNKASSNFDQRHLMSVSYVYDVPLLKF